MRSLWTRRSMIVFFLVGFGVPWVGWTTRALTGVEGPSKIALFYTGDFMTIAGFMATFVAAGAIGFRSLLRRYVQVKAPRRLGAVRALHPADVDRDPESDLRRDPRWDRQGRHRRPCALHRTGPFGSDDRSSR